MTYLSEHISERLRKMVVSERRPKDGREGSHSGYSNYTTSTPSSIENRYPNLTPPIDQFIPNKDIKITKIIQ